MNDSSVPMLIIGLVVALGVGFIMGLHSAPETSYVAAPSNYDPSAPSLKVSEAATKRCYDLLVDSMKARAEVDRTAH